MAEAGRKAGEVSATYWRTVLAAAALALCSAAPVLAQAPAPPVLYSVEARGHTVIVSWVPANDYTISHRLEAGSAPGLTDIATLDVPITQSTYFLTDVPAAT